VRRCVNERLAVDVLFSFKGVSLLDLLIASGYVNFFSKNQNQILIEQWRKEYNTVRPHSSLGYKPPVPETIALNYRERTKKEEKKTLIH